MFQPYQLGATTLDRYRGAGRRVEGRQSVCQARLQRSCITAW